MLILQEPFGSSQVQLMAAAPCNKEPVSSVSKLFTDTSPATLSTSSSTFSPGPCLGAHPWPTSQVAHNKSVPVISSMLLLSSASRSALRSVAALLCSARALPATRAPALLRVPAGRSGDSSPRSAVEQAASSMIWRRSSFTRWFWPAWQMAMSEGLPSWA